MSLRRTTNLGTIIINTSIISKEVIKASTKVNENIFFATEKGKLLGSPKKVGSSELSANILVDEKEGRFNLTLYIIMNFGSSIKKVTESILDDLEESFKMMFPSQPGKITIKIVGVKSKKIAARDIEVIREYEATR